MSGFVAGGIRPPRIPEELTPWHPIPGDPADPGPGGSTTDPTELLRTYPWGISMLGFQNVGAYHEGLDWYAVGADVAAVAIYTDPRAQDPIGKPARDGLDDPNLSRVASLAWEGGTSRRLWGYMTGHDAGNPGFLCRMDVTAKGDPGRWTVVRKVLGGMCYAGNGQPPGDTKASNPSGHPRQTGPDLLRLLKARGCAIVGTHNGLRKVQLDGSADSLIWGSGKSITGIHIDPSADSTIYVTVDVGSGGSQGFYKLHWDGSGTCTQLGFIAVDYPQSIAGVKVGSATHLFVATGKGVNQASPGNSIIYLPPGDFLASRIVQLDGPRTTTGAAAAGNINYGESGTAINRWCGIDVQWTESGYRILATHSNDTSGAKSTKVAWTTWAGGTTIPRWEKISSSTFSDKMNYPGGPAWAGVGVIASKNLLIYQGGFDSVSPRILPDGTFIIPGRSGQYRKRSTDSAFHPFGRGLVVTYAWDIVPHPTDPLFAAQCDTDWVAFGLDAPFTGEPRDYARPTYMVGRVGYFDPANGGYLLVCSETASQADGTVKPAGGIWTTEDPRPSNPVWVDQTRTGSGRTWGKINNPGKAQFHGLMMAEARGGMRRGTGTNMKILMAASGLGVQLKTGTGEDGNWQQASGIPTSYTFPSLNRAHFVDLGGTAYLSHPAAGLLKSNGTDWTSFTTVKNLPWTHSLSGHLRRDPTRAGVAWWQTLHDTGGRIFKVVGNSVTDIETPIGRAAALAVDPATGHIYVAETTPNVRLWRTTDGFATDPVDITTQSWKNLNGIVRSMGITADGKYLLTANQGGGSVTPLKA